MVRRGNDPGYCVVSTDAQEGSASVETVGRVCRELAYWRLVGVVHLQTTDGRPARALLRLYQMRGKLPDLPAR